MTEFNAIRLRAAIDSLAHWERMIWIEEKGWNEDPGEQGCALCKYSRTLAQYGNSICINCPRGFASVPDCGGGINANSSNRFIDFPSHSVFFRLSP